MKTFVFDSNFCTIKIYRVTLIAKFNESNEQFVSRFLSKLDENDSHNGVS